MNKEEQLKLGIAVFGIAFCIIGGIFIIAFLCSFIYFLYHLIRYKEKEPIIANSLEIFCAIIDGIGAIGESGSSIHYSGSSHSSSSGFGGGSSRGGGAGRSF